MTSERQRLLGLALETLMKKKDEIDQEIAMYTRQLGGARRRTLRIPQARMSSNVAYPVKRHFSFSREERRRRSQRMKAYWENWRKKRGRQR